EKFGCSVEQLQELNGKETFAVGDTIKVPGELEADHAELQNRKTSEEAKIEEQNDKANAAAEAQRRAQVAAQQRQRQAQVAAQREQKQAQAAARRAQEDATLKSLGLIRRTNDKTKLVAKFPDGRKVNLTKVGDANYNRSIYKDKNGKFYVVSHDNKVLKEAYVKNTNLYQSGRKVKGRMVDKNGRGVYKTFAEVPGAKKDAHGRRVVVDEKGRAYWMASDNTILKDSYIENSNRADAVRSNTAVARKETMAMLKSQVDSAQAAFDAQMREDGWAGDVADGVSALWGSKNRAKYVRQELQQFKNDIVELQNCKSDAEFKAKFKQKFGIPYSEKAVADYIMNPNSSNYRKAFGTKRNIGERVAKYNESQQSGATVVKTAAEVGAAVALTAATVATGGAAGVAAAVVVAGSSAFAADLVVETSDRMSSEQGLQEGEMTEILKGAATDGVIAAATMGVSKAGQAAYKVGKAAYVSSKVASSGGKAVVAGEKAVSSSASKALAATTEKAIATSEKAVAKAGSGAAQMVETSVTKAEAAVAKTETAVGKTTQAAASTQSAATNAVDVTLSRTEEAIIDTMADVSVGAGAEYIETGEITAAGTLTNMAVGATGLAGEKLAHSGIVKKVRSSISDSYHRAKDGIGDAFSAASDKFRYSGPDINPSGGAGGAGRPHSGADGASTSNGASQKTSGADSSSGNAHNAGKTDGHTNRADNAHNTNNTNNAEPNRNQRADKSQDTNSTQKTQNSSQEPKPMSEQEIKQAMDELEPKLK
ncbi:hypothetical protein IJ596_01550, partial [bacterium]|nr:hypothetical protein [bacterium]